MLQLLRDGTLFKRMSKLASLGYQRECKFLYSKIFYREKGKAQVHLIEPISEGREKALMGLEKSLQFPKDVMDVMAQTKRPTENTIHLDISIKKFKEMARAPKEKKESKAKVWLPKLSNF
jgi:hypothetical protein